MYAIVSGIPTSQWLGQTIIYTNDSIDDYHFVVLFDFRNHFQI